MDIAYADPADDIDLLLEMMQEYYAFDNIPFNARIARVALQGLLADPALGRVWIVREDGEPAGYVVLTIGYSLEYLGRDGFIDELYLRESFRGRGIGRQMMKRLEQYCRDNRVHALHLEVDMENTDAQAFYGRIGFKNYNRFLYSKRIEQ